MVYKLVIAASNQNCRTRRRIKTLKEKIIRRLETKMGLQNTNMEKPESGDLQCCIGAESGGFK